MKIDVSDMDAEITESLVNIINYIESNPESANVLDTISELLKAEDQEVVELMFAMAKQEVAAADVNEERLTDRETVVIDHIKTDQNEELLSASEIADHATGGKYDIGSEYSSLQYRSHVSDTLNSLLDKGQVGKIESGGTTYYTTPKAAIRHWLTERGMPEEVPIVELADDTGVPVVTAKRYVDQLSLSS